jgi:Tfp pilus assembly protein PilO
LIRDVPYTMMELGLYENIKSAIRKVRFMIDMMMMMLLNINYNMAMGYKVYLYTNTDQPEQHKYKMKSIRSIYS